MEDNGAVNLKFVCRTCLTSDAEFYKLDAPINGGKRNDEKISFAECLRYCTRLENNKEMPIYICNECSSALEVTYKFIKNAINAHEYLRQRLGIGPTQQQRNNGLLPTTDIKAEYASTNNSPDRPMRFRCKICSDKLSSKQALKEHVKLHLDIIKYCCECCNFESKRRSQLMLHYRTYHGINPTEEQLKIKTLNNVVRQVKSEIDTDNDEIMAQMEKIHNPTKSIAAATATSHSMTTTSRRVQSKAVPEQMQQFERNVQQHVNQLLAQTLTPVTRRTRAMSTLSSQNQAAHLLPTLSSSSAEQIDVSGVLPTDLNLNALDAAALHTQFANDITVTSNEMSVGNEFVVMEDGTVQEVYGNGVVIEYINNAAAENVIDNNLILNSVIQIDPNEPATNSLDDVDDIIIDESNATADAILEDGMNIEDELPTSIITPSVVDETKLIKCKICTDRFIMPEDLKKHMLTHKEIPHFFCDQCSYYTFFKVELNQHYRSRHKLQPTPRQLQPKNKVEHKSGTTKSVSISTPTTVTTAVPNVKHIYSCDMCLYETHLKINLRRHYFSKHQVDATDVQLRPTVDDTDMDYMSIPPTTRSQLTTSNKRLSRPDFPNGINCKKCSKVFYWRDKLKDHYKQHEEAEIATMTSHDDNRNNVLTNCNVTHVNRNANVHEQQHLQQEQLEQQQKLQEELKLEEQQHQQVMQQQLEQEQQQQLQSDQYVGVTAYNNNVATNSNVTVVTNTSAHQHEINLEQLIGVACGEVDVDVDTVEEHQINANMNICTQQQQQLPLDAIPQIVEQDNIIVDNVIDFDFNGDAIFEDFGDEENENDTEDFQDLLLTSDDDFEELLEERESIIDNHDQQFCIHCQKRIYGQYQFENHMFIHRGLAPYRCEMCTNLYNTKRALIRHYRAVHKRIPTRDMIQAKGDKLVVDDQTPIDQLVLEERTTVTLMCAKCPYESMDLSNLKLHLANSHNITDDNYILRKLPFECPRCIRSFESKRHLLRHLERSHSAATITQQQKLSPAEEQPIANAAESANIGVVSSSTSHSDSNTNHNNGRSHTTKQDDSSGGDSSEHEQNLSPLTTNTANNLATHSEHGSSSALQQQKSKLNHFQCNLCNGSYKTSQLLKLHQKRHTVGKHKSTDCSKSYITRQELEQHTRTHTGVSPYSCTMCMKSFRYPHHLKRHKDRAHYGKRYKCPLLTCDHTFSSRDQLKVHSLTHSGRMPYACTYCERAYALRESLRQHAWSAHTIKLTEEQLAQIYRDSRAIPHDFMRSKLDPSHISSN